MIYTPVRIHTLNRYKKFKACLDSLERCTGAEHTEVFIGLDYPPSEKYVEGWKKIDQYLAEKEKKNGFKALHVYRRDHNCGVGGPNSNAALLSREVRARYDQWVSSEDDNVFSPCFLEYINKGLELAQKDKRIYAVCGYSQPYNFYFAENNHYAHNTDYCTWGYGITKAAEDESHVFARSGGFRKSFSIKNCKKFYNHGLNRLYNYITCCFFYNYENMRTTDDVLTCYLILNDMYALYPKLSLVRNIGWETDGHTYNPNDKRAVAKVRKYADVHLNQVIDSSNSFNFKGDYMSYFDENNKCAAINSEARISLFDFVCMTSIYMIKYFAKNIGCMSLVNKYRLWKKKSLKR